MPLIRPLMLMLAVFAIASLSPAPVGIAPCHAAIGLKQSSYMVRMGDGTRLATDVYLPRLPGGRYPVVLMRTPNSKDEITRLQARYVCRQGWGLVIQDTRGRHCSQGRGALAFHSDGWEGEQDGHDTIRWIARQRWCNGRVGTWGPSVMGALQNLLAPDAPSALKAQHVMMAFSDMYSQVAYQGGAFRKSLVERWLSDGRYDPANLDAVLSHWKYDSFWDNVNTDKQAHRVNAPAVFWGGWYDPFLQGTINSFVNVHNQGGSKARGNCRLIIGPWNHNDIRKLVDPRERRRAPMAADPFRFFEHWLKCQRNGVSRDKAVHYYVMGDRCDRHGPGNRWRRTDNWPPLARPTEYFLHADGSLLLVESDATEAKLSYRYDPKDPVPTVGGQNLKLAVGPKDQRRVECRQDVLLFTTEPLEESVEIVGPIKATLFIASDCPDTDFTVKLTDVYPDGRSVLLTDGILRARFRETFAEEHMLEPGNVYPITVDLWSTAVAFSRGHRIRVAVSSSNAPRFEPNPNTGLPGHLSEETRIATNTIYVDRDRPSHILLPVVER